MGDLKRADGALSWRWIGVSYGVFIASELLLGGLVARLIAGKFVGHVAQLRLEAILILASYYAGGFIVGFASPRVRVAEPAIGAALSVATTFLIAFFSPFGFLSFKTARVVMGGVIAFFLAFVGARSGEKAAAMMGNDASADYVERS
ncbi:MAG: hypothetical protein AUJ52_08900 [Elusimicrobia bacterium CG1_02_63_36]|nr:MAG: hypothetical protein AUJ52_08900 [Elusimicrobia bacterium CG1_02_63_36]PIP82641.1 MAG: hypothetical protein COR54_13905 [Elusimicrobia bacterium CG22_combo_CG10-13_8_21_14_all_63_91]PJA16754.1 MAG: hypothetical protein COX66_06805 [Elusimicrobia bacterium CG_4_10_14_0_2_um_filter_63_34]PJB24100.1 MAG: hypothetical protein CO113_15775 [Elusimicrobia bacterium CG_4_9_14_3_um_filter_62_55]